MTDGPAEARIEPCPGKPNCVSSSARENPERFVEPFEIVGEPDQAWSVLQAIVEKKARFRVVERSDRYLHVVARTAVFRFKDDVEFELRPDLGLIAVRSESRVGYSDLGANRRRIERLRLALRDAGVVR